MTLTDQAMSHRLSGIERVTVVAGKRLKVETSPQGLELLNVVVPTGKVWSALVLVEITETDA